MVTTASGDSCLAALIDEPDGGVLRLPAGRVIPDDEGPVLWLSDDEPDGQTVARLRANHVSSGLWPVLIGDDPSWDTTLRLVDGELLREIGVPPSKHPWVRPFYPLLRGSLGNPRWRWFEPPEAETWLADRWAEEVARNEANDHWDPEERVSALAPSGAAWPGLAPAAEALGEPLAIADWHAAMMLEENWLGRPRLALFEGASSSEALAAARWAPAGEGNFLAHIQVLQSWEQRFGARVVALKPDTLYLSVSAPPVTPEHAVHVACEHLAFCHDAVWQCSDSFEDHAEGLIGSPCWGFWWD
ncbi:hypothetical protein ABH935_007374 [Catenulispora sp. GAS73]|uniref:DUF4253 domain-containing protein n=1 Tax=Catenulispora sp. GAS73 TaxID=3156269 RepID=UPI003519472F